MLFTHDTEEALSAAVELVNSLPETDSEGVDRFTDLAHYRAFLQAHAYSGTVVGDAAEHAGVRGIRPALAALWAVERDDAVPLVNRMLADGRALPRLVRHDEHGWHIHATDDDAPLHTRILVESAMAFVDVIRTDAWERLRTCSAPDCRSVYVDLSRNGSKRYCDTGNCGNRMNVIAYRQRKAAGTP